MSRPVIIRVAKTGGLYFSPGAGPVTALAELFLYTGSGTPSLVWTGPDESAQWRITCLYPYGGKMLAFLSDSGSYACRVYQYTPGGTATKVVDDFWPDGGSGWDNAARQATTYNGKIYVNYGGTGGPHYLVSFDPATWARTDVQADTAADEGAGGVAVGPSDGHIYWSSGRKIYSSVDGTAGSFGLLLDATGTYGTKRAVLNGLVPHTDGYIYTGGIYRTGITQFYARIYRMKDDVVTISADRDETTRSLRFPASLTSLSSGISCVFIEWETYSLFNSGSGWANDIPDQGMLGVPAGGAVMKDAAYFLMSDGGSTMELWRRDGAASASRIASYSGYSPYLCYYNAGPIGVLA